MNTDVPCFETIAQLIQYQAQHRPNAIAIAAPNQLPLTYADLDKQIQQIVDQLNELGIGHGDRVALVLPNGPAMAVAFLAVAAAAISAPLNPTYQEAEFDFYLRDLEVKAVITLAGMASPVRKSANKQQIPILELVPHDKEGAGVFHLIGTVACPAIAPSEPQPPDIALILHSSGTTSRPKMVPLTHSNLCHSAQFLRTALALTPDDRGLNIMPLFHSHGLVTMLLGSLASGGCVICAPGFVTGQFFNWWAIERPTWYSAIPTLHQAILAEAEIYYNRLVHAPLRFIRSASAALSPLVLKQLEQTFHVPVIQGYGMTEAQPIASNPLPPAQRRLGSVGLATGVDIAILNDQGMVLDTGEIGEVIVRGITVTQGYLNNPNANADAFYQGWFRTGDRGYLDEQGYLFLQGRFKEIINRGGEKVTPQEIDEVLMEYPGVLQAVTFAVPHPTLGEDVAAAVVPRQGVTLSTITLRQWLFQRLAAYKIPSQVVIVEAIPKSATGKLQRIGLAQKLADVLHRPYCPPRNKTEQDIAAMMTEVLGIEQISIFDNFFSLGGDSLTGTQVIARVYDRLYLNIPLRYLFEHPTIAEFAGAIEELSTQKSQQASPKITARGREAKRCILLKINVFNKLNQYMKHSLSHSNLDSTETTSISDEVYLFPASFAQQRLWFLDQLEGPSATYTNASARSLQGTLHIPALEQTIQTLVQRHETLRTTFRVIDNAPMQVIRPRLTLSFSQIDLTRLQPEDQSHQIQTLIQEFAQHVFDLQTGPLIRVSLAQLSTEHHVLLLAMHHIITDGWSMQVFWQEFATLYQAFSQGQSSPLPDLPIQYADYTLWQQEWLQGEVFADQLAYWKQQLGGELPILQLPIDRPRPLVQTHNGSHQAITISAETTQALKSLSQSANATLFMALLAAFQTLLHRYSGQADIIVGTPIAGRNPVATEPLIGFFANTLALRTNLAGNPTFRQLVEQVREVALGAYSHADIPFEKLVEELRPRRDPSRSPLFQVMFSLQHSSSREVKLPELVVEALPISRQTAKFDLILALKETVQGLHTRIEYNTDLFEDATITRMLGHWQTLLDGIASNPDQPIGQLPFLPESERHQLLVEWNDTATDYPKDKCIHQLFEAQVERTPDAVAVIFEDRFLTYREVNVKANQIAHFLQSLDVKSGTFVGVCLEQSLEMIVALIGILKAGGTYVPIDPTSPQARLEYLLSDAQISILLTQQQLADRFSTYSANIVCLDSDWEKIAGEQQSNPISHVTAEDFAYVMYTSGSTGKPKGVLVPHRAVNRLILNTNYIQLTPNDRIAQAANPAFDAATFEIWGALLQGAGLVLIPQQILLSFQQFTESIHRHKITVLFLTTALFNQIASLIPYAFGSLRYLLVGGEAIDPQWMRKVLQDGAPQHLLHVYGPTENTTFSTGFLVENVAENALTIPIGRPIANTQIYLLDQNLQPVPVGVIGELYLGGDGLAQGYLNQPRLTDTQFIPNPFGSDRLYRTGDLGRYRADGNLEFMGRIDHQVKIRGFRVELSEIEVALTQHPQVQEAVVFDRTDQTGDIGLVAYVVPTQPQFLTAIDLRQFLKRKLPAYMIPTAFVLLESIPLTPNGKVDRRQLESLAFSTTSSPGYPADPVPVWLLPGIESSLFGPQNITQEMLAQLWGEVLELRSAEKGITPLNIFADFFEIGGHSLAASRLIYRIEDLFQVRLSLQHLFENPTIFGLSQCLETEQTPDQLAVDSPYQNIVPLQTGGSCPPLFWVTGGAGDENTFLFYAKLIFLLGQEQPVYGLCNCKNQGGGWLSLKGFHSTVEALATDYVKAIRTIQPEGPYLMIGECVGSMVAYEVAQQLIAQGQTVERLLLLDPPDPQQANRALTAALENAPSPAEISNAIEQALSQNNRGLFQQTAFLHQKAIVAAYQLQPYAGSITLIVAENSRKPTAAWELLALGGIESYLVPGNHDSYLGQFVQTTAMQLRTCLDAIHAKIKLGETPQLPLIPQAQFSLQPNRLIHPAMETGGHADDRLERLLLRASEINPKQIDFHLHLSRLYEQQSQWEAVIPCAQKVIDLDPSCIEGHRMMGNAFRFLGRWHEALPCFQTVIELNPDLADVYVELGHTQQELALVNDAIESCQKAIALDPSLYWAYRILGNLLRSLGRWPEALPYIQKAIELNPNDAVVYAELGQTQQELADIEAAIVNYQKALSLDSSLDWVYRNLGNLLRSLGRWQEALPCFERAVELTPNLADVYVELGHTQQELAQVNDAIASYQKALSLNASLYWAHRNLGNLFRSLGHWLEAFSCLQEAIALDPNGADVYVELGHTQQQLAQIEDAIESCQKAIALNPSLYWAYRILGDLLIHQGNPEQTALAAYCFQQAILFTPESIDRQNSLNLIRLSLDCLANRLWSNSEEHIDAYSLPNQHLQVETAPVLGQAYRTLGEAYQQWGNPDAAMACIETAMKLSP